MTYSNIFCVLVIILFVALKLSHLGPVETPHVGSCVFLTQFHDGFSFWAHDIPCSFCVFLAPNMEVAIQPFLQETLILGKSYTHYVELLLSLSIFSQQSLEIGSSFKKICLLVSKIMHSCCDFIRELEKCFICKVFYKNAAII